MPFLSLTFLAVEEDIADEISEDDLELIQENYGIEGKSKKRLIRKGEMDKDGSKSFNIFFQHCCIFSTMTT